GNRRPRRSSSRCPPPTAGPPPRLVRLRRAPPRQGPPHGRVRLPALLGALAVLVGACATVPGGAVATGNGRSVSYDRFERIVSTQAEGLGLSGRDAAVVQAAFDSGLVDRQSLDDALLQELQRGEDSRIIPGPPLEVEDELVDELYEEQVADG